MEHRVGAAFAPSSRHRTGLAWHHRHYTKSHHSAGGCRSYTFVAGDLHEADFGQGHAIAILGHILHSEGEERSRWLLRKTFDALTPGGTIAIAEILVDAERRAAVPALIFAVNMLVNSDQGDTFTFEEIRGWLQDAGFEQVRTVEAPGLAPLLILATKPIR